MPLIAWLLIAYLAGLLTGFAGAHVSLAILFAAVATFLAAREKLALAALTAFLALGVAAAAASRDANERCIRAVANTDTITVKLDRDAAPGSFASGHLFRCPAGISIFAAEGRAPAGATIQVRGHIVRSGDGKSLAVQGAALTIRAPPSWTARLRRSAEINTDGAFDADAPIVKALVLADMSDMPADVRDRWAAAGLAHMLSVSGLHVGIIAMVVELLLGVARVNRKAAPIASAVVIVVYVVIIGAPPPAVRSAAMLALRGLCRLVQRPVSPWAYLAVGAAQPIFDPPVVLDLGYQLSVIGVGALIAGASLVKRLEIRGPKLRRDLLAGLAITVVASIATAPLVAWSFGRVSLIAPLSNLLAGPVIAVVQPILFLAVLVGPFASVARFVAGASHPLLISLDGIASFSAQVPGASVTVWPSTGAALAAGVISVCVLVACAHDRPARPLTLAVAAVVLLLFAPRPPEGQWTELHMIDVGQGDAIALHTRADHWVLIDAGRIWPGGDAGKRTVTPYIAHQGGKLVGFILSHPHADHVGGASSVLDALRPDWYYDAAFIAHSGPYDSSLVAARRDQVRWRRVHPGESLTVDEATIRFLAPDSVFEASLPDPNNASTVVLIIVGRRRFLLMGDAEREEEDWLLAHQKDWLGADVLKVGHHGSSTSSTPAFLDAVRPSIALVSVGFHNSYGHPSNGVMADLAGRGAEVLRTDQVGTVVLATDGNSLLVRGR